MTTKLTVAEYKLLQRELTTPITELVELEATMADFDSRKHIRPLITGNVRKAIVQYRAQAANGFSKKIRKKTDKGNTYAETTLVATDYTNEAFIAGRNAQSEERNAIRAFMATTILAAQNAAYEKV